MIGWRSKPSTTEEDKPKGFDDFELRLGDLMRGERATLGKSLLDVQRELKIKATYIAAIENADLSAFETPGFVAGYVRSYARYLAMDPEWAFERFCAEAGYSVSHGLSSAAAPQQIVKARARRAVSDPLGDPNASFIPRGEAIWSQIEPGAIGSVAVLIALIGAIGYGGWSVLQEVQRVQLAPVDEAPTVVAQIDPLSNVGTAAPKVVATRPAEPAAQTVASAEGTASVDVMDRLYRPKALDVPVLTARDGPIAAINPRQTGVLADVAEADAVDAAIDEAVGGDVQVIADAKEGVEVLAVRPSWVRVNAADGTVLFEKILDAGERYAVPPLETAAVFRTGNSGAIYFVVDGVAYGPAAPGAQVVKDIKLSPEALTQTFAQADLTKDQDLANFATADAADVLPAPAASE
ncbi:helix-turn-helix domain-containing protein [Tabrizicola thermarum]|uniref:helix-turn-helix domain-containing protein n=1 Tax=Tabrizicola thermarum TaxID=2670345 RepID=UPI000FFC94FF|nr:helix-turn-helix domain-containing protein [Tabrizicola thermarum]